MTAAAPAAASAPVARLDVHVGELRQLFNSLDPAPFRERDLDPEAERFIVEWGREAPADGPLALAVHVAAASPGAGEAALLAQSVRDHFARAAASERARLTRLFRTGRVSLVVGVLFVAAANVVGDMVGELLRGAQYGRVLAESIVIGAWVALWRPLEIFLYDWWPIRAEARLFDRLAAMSVDVIPAPQNVGAAP